MIWLLSLVICSFCAGRDYYQGKVVALKQSNYRRALLDFEIVVMSFESNECNVSRTCRGQFKRYFDGAANSTQSIIDFNKLPLGVQFCRLLYEESPQAFIDLKVEAAPSVRIYINGTDIGFGIDDVFDFTQPTDLSSWVIEKLLLVPPLSPEQHRPNINYAVVIGCDQLWTGDFNTARLHDNHNQYVCSSTGDINGVLYPENSVLLMRDGKILRQHKALTDGPIFHWIRRFEGGYVRKLDEYVMHLIFAQRYRTMLLLTHLDDESSKALQIFSDIARESLESSDANLHTLLFVHSHVEDSLQLHVQLRKFIGVQDKRYPYPHLTYLQMEQNLSLSKYHMDAFEPSKTLMADWMSRVLSGADPQFKKSEVFKRELDPEKVFESVGLDYLREETRKNPMKDLILYVRSGHADDQMMELRSVVQSMSFPPKHLNSFLKISITENDMLEGMVVASLPQFVHIKNGAYSYLQAPHTKQNMMQWLDSKVQEIWPAEVKEAQAKQLPAQDQDSIPSVESPTDGHSEEEAKQL